VSILHMLVAELTAKWMSRNMWQPGEKQTSSVRDTLMLPCRWSMEV